MNGRWFILDFQDHLGMFTNFKVKSKISINTGLQLLNAVKTERIDSIRREVNLYYLDKKVNDNKKHMAMKLSIFHHGDFLSSTPYPKNFILALNCISMILLLELIRKSNHSVNSILKEGSFSVDHIETL
ncbi:hypothetical protein ACTFIU_006838 [Dictyostelium citrinum]